MRKNFKPESYSTKLKEQFDKLYNKEVKKLELKVDEMCIQHDRKLRNAAFNVGENVWLQNSIRKKGVFNKFALKWTGPYNIVGVLPEVKYQIMKDNSKKKLLVH